jgi:hypothetical protein
MATPQQVNGLPNGWVWSYTPGHGYKGRHAYSIYNHELAMPVRAVQKIQHGADFKKTLNASLERRDVILEIHKNYKFAGHEWRSVDFQFSTGALRFIENLPDTQRIFITIVGVPIEGDSGSKIDDDGSHPDARISGVGGYKTASYYKNTKNWYENVVLPAYNRYDPILNFSVHYEL